MLIEDAFKEWTKAIAKGITNGGKDPKIQPEKIQLLDLSKISLNYDKYVLDTYKEVIRDSKNKNLYHIKPYNWLDVYTPFEETYIHLSEYLSKEEIEGLGRGIINEFVYLRNSSETGLTQGTVELYIAFNNGHTQAITYCFYLSNPEEGITIEFPTRAMNETMGNDNGIMQDCIIALLLLFHILKQLSTTKHNLYTAPVNPQKTYRNSRNKQVHFHNKPVYIYTDKTVNVKKAQSFSRGTPVQHITSWPVRGHWRRLDNPNKRGKNAKGEYVIEGRTWVKPHICGNKNLPVRQRTYIALSSDASTSSL